MMGVLIEEDLYILKKYGIYLGVGNFVKPKFPLFALLLAEAKGALSIIPLVRTARSRLSLRQAVLQATDGRTANELTNASCVRS